MLGLLLDVRLTPFFKILLRRCHPKMERQPRNPRDLQGLLKFCLETTKSEDAPGDHHVEAMDPERKAWLERVLKEMSVDVFQELGKCIAALSDESVVADRRATDLSLQLHAFDCVEDWVGQIEMANNFQRLGGFVALRGCLASPHDELAAGASRIVAELAQNNPYCQEKLTQEEFLPALLQCANDSTSPALATKVLSAMSCLTRGYEPARRQLTTSGDGLATVVRLLQNSRDGRLRAKASFFLTALASEDPEVARALARLGLPELLVAMLDEADGEDEDGDAGVNWREHVAAALLAVSKNSQEAADSCKKLNVDVGKILRKRLEKVKGKEEFQEEEEHYKELLSIYSCDKQPVVDR